MKRDIFNIILSRIMVDKKKAIIALCLVVIMVVMWVRSFTGKTQAIAEILVTSNQAAAAQDNLETKMSFMELPYVKGRNDVLNRDFFAVGRLKPTEDENTNVDSSGDESHIKQLIDNLKLEAIGMGKTPQAFIDGKVYTIKDELILEDSGDTYKFQIVGIEKKTVLIKYGQTQVELKLTE
jgi:hypothetical protein